MKNIAVAFVKAKKAFAPAIKNSSNPHFKNKYADLAACLEAVDDSFLANGIVLYQETFEDSTGVTVETVLLHESGETIRCGKLHMPATKQDAQGYGSALSYARRYSLMAACGIAPEDDDGQGAAAAKRKQDASPPAADAPTKDVSPKAVARRLATGVSAGDAVGVCDYLIGLDDGARDSIWALLDAKTQDKLTAVWPKEPA